MSEELLNTTVEQEYDASQIQVLEGLEAVRKRPGMYIGSTSASGLHHLVYEIVDNAIDEALAGYCNHIEVKILKDNIIQVTDNGRGIPVDIQADTGLPSAAITLSRIAMIARPSLELIRLSTINNVTMIRINPIRKVESFGVPVIPCGPFRITVPSGSMSSAITSFVAK